MNDNDTSLHQAILIEKLGKKNQIILKGKVSPAKLWKLTQRAYIGLNIAENCCLSYYLSLANKTFDYIHAEVPQVMINFPEFVRVNQQFKVGICIENLEEKTIINAIDTLMSDDSKYMELVKNCKAASHEFNWEKESQLLLNLYYNLWSKNGN